MPGPLLRRLAPAQRHQAILAGQGTVGNRDVQRLLSQGLLALEGEPVPPIAGAPAVAQPSEAPEADEAGPATTLSDEAPAEVARPGVPRRAGPDAGAGLDQDRPNPPLGASDAALRVQHADAGSGRVARSAHEAARTVHQGAGPVGGALGPDGVRSGDADDAFAQAAQRETPLRRNPGALVQRQDIPQGSGGGKFRPRLARTDPPPSNLNTTVDVAVRVTNPGEAPDDTAYVEWDLLVDPQKLESLGPLIALGPSGTLKAKTKEVGTSTAVSQLRYQEGTLGALQLVSAEPVTITVPNVTAVWGEGSVTKGQRVPERARAPGKMFRLDTLTVKVKLRGVSDPTTAAGVKPDSVVVANPSAPPKGEWVGDEYSWAWTPESGGAGVE